MTRETAETYALAAVGAAEGVFQYWVRPELTARRTWAFIGAVAVAHEVFCPPGELLSEGADRLIAKHRWVPFAGAVLAAHVLNVIPENIDPIHQLARRLRPVHQ